MNGLKVLVTGDLHIGRIPKVSEADIEEISASEAWGRIVDVAIQEKVLVVCLTGDIADSHNKFTEARSVLGKGLSDLGKNGIKTVAVSGNHDHAVLTRLADSFDSEVFQLLGSEQEWERVIIQDSGVDVLTIDGWSYGERSVFAQPIESYNFSQHGELPSLAMIHGEMKDPNTRYAFLSKEKMLKKRVDGWLLGHIHKRELIESPGDPFVLYPGSPQALHANETGVHSIEIINLSPAVSPEVKPIPISTVRYVGVDEIDIDFSSFDEQNGKKDAYNYVFDDIADKIEKIKDESGEKLKYVVFRLLLKGQTDLAKNFEDIEILQSELMKMKDFPEIIHGVRCSVEKVDCTLLPKIHNLYDLSRNKSPIGIIALAITEIQEKPEVEYSQSTRNLFKSGKSEIQNYRKNNNYEIHDENDDGCRGYEISDDEVKNSILSQLSAIFLKCRLQIQK